MMKCVCNLIYCVGFGGFEDWQVPEIGILTINGGIFENILEAYAHYCNLTQASNLSNNQIGRYI
jgi:hypothetical protein